MDTKKTGGTKRENRCRIGGTKGGQSAINRLNCQLKHTTKSVDYFGNRLIFQIKWK